MRQPWDPPEARGQLAISPILLGPTEVPSAIKKSTGSRLKSAAGSFVVVVVVAVVADVDEGGQGENVRKTADCN